MADSSTRISEPLSWSCLRFTFRCLSPLWLDSFVGARFAGDLGVVLRQHNCQFGLKDPPPCRDFEKQCLYGYLMRTQAVLPTTEEEQGLKRIDVPHPLICDPLDARKTRYHENEIFTCDITLFGRAIQTWPLLVDAVLSLCKRGLGRKYREGSGRLELQDVRPVTRSRQPAFLQSSLYDNKENRLLDSPSLTTLNDMAERTRYLQSSYLKMILLRPLYLRDVKKPIEFSHLWQALTTRLQLLSRYHSGAELNLDFPFLAQQARQIKVISRDVRWQDQQRFSHSQKKIIRAGGLLGNLQFEGDFSVFLPLLAAGEWLHLGKDCDLGNGRYMLEAL